MNITNKPFLISIGIEIGVIILLRITKGLWQESEIIFSNHLIKWILIAIIRPLIGLLRNTKEKNSQFLKKVVIALEIYLFLLIFLQPWTNFSQGEFLIFYLCLVGITNETLSPNIKKRKSKSLIIFYTIVSVFMISIALFMRYREPINKNEIINQKEYQLIIKISPDLNTYYTKIYLTEKWKARLISIPIGIQKILLEKNTEYQIEFFSQDQNKNSRILIQDPEGNLIQIFSQTAIQFSTNKNKITFIDSQNKALFYEKETTQNPEEITSFQKNYQEDIKWEILKKIPSRGRKNEKFQKRSLQYTNFLAKFLPFQYKKNAEYAKEYSTYYQLSQKNEYEKVENQIDLIKNNTKIWSEKINSRNKYKEYFKNLF